MMSALARDGRGGVLALGDAFNQVHRLAIIALALEYRIPTIVASRQITESGGQWGDAAACSLSDFRLARWWCSLSLRRALSPTFPAGEMVVFFIPWRVVAEESGAAQ